MTAVPASRQPFPYLEFLPHYSPQLVDTATRNLRDLYDQAERDLNRRWAQIVDDPLAGRTRARLNELFDSLERSRQSVNASVAEWIRTTYPAYYHGGAVNTLATYGGPGFRWAQPHRDAVGLLAVDTYSSLLRATEFEPSAIKQTVRELARVTAAEKLLGGKTATQAGKELASKLRAQGIANVTYADGRKVGIGTYSDMVIRARTAIAYNAGGINSAVADGVEFFEINDGLECGLETHDSKPAAAGMIVTQDVASMFPISHPNCVRSFYPRPDLSRAQVDAGDIESLVDPRSAEDQLALDTFVRREQAANGLTIRQAAAKYGRQERTARTARVPRTPRSSTPPPIAPPALPPVAPPPPAHPFLAPLEGTEPHPMSIDRNMSTVDLYRAQEARAGGRYPPPEERWIDMSGAAGPKALAREEAFNRVGGNVLDEVNRQLEAKGMRRPPTATEISALQKERAKVQASLFKRERKILADFEYDTRFPKGPRLPADYFDLPPAAREAADREHRFARVAYERDRRAAMLEYDTRLRTLSTKLERLNGEIEKMLDDKIANEGRFYQSARDTVIKVLREVRSMGEGRFNLLDFDAGLDTLAEDVATMYPTEWVEASNARNPIVVRTPPDGRGFYRDADGRNGGVSLVALSKDARSKVGYDQEGVGVAIHEFGHRMEEVRAEIKSLEHAFFSRRTVGELPKKLRDLFPGSNYRDNEYALPDKFVNAYMGKSYSGGGPNGEFELLSMALEGLFSGSQDVWADEDMLRWVLGILAAA